MNEAEKNMNCESDLDTLFATARRNEAALVLALEVNDETACLVTAARLREALAEAKTTLDAIPHSTRRAALSLRFHESRCATSALLRRAPSRPIPTENPRLVRWITAPGRTPLARCGPDLFELDVTGVELPRANFYGLHIARCRFITTLQYAQFVDAFIERSDFTYSNLGTTLWWEAEVRRSFFRDSSFVGAAFEQVTFVDCDLRRTDFGVGEGAAPPFNARFVRCDLRDTNWGGRDLSKVELVECTLAGAVGPVRGPLSSLALRQPATRSEPTIHGMQRSEVVELGATP